MLFRFAVALLLPALLLNAAKKKEPGHGRGENEDLTITATLYTEPDQIKELIGSDLGGYYIVVDLKAEPKYGKDVTLRRDDFVLRTDKDGEKSEPFVGSQIAGNEALVVTEEGAQTRKTRGFSGITLGGGAIGAGGNDDGGQRKTAIKTDATTNPLKKVLNEKMLPEGKTDKPVTGLLYFPLQKQKMKDLKLLYGGPENRISIRFK
jgi:hypothetical protein